MSSFHRICARGSECARLAFVLAALVAASSLALARQETMGNFLGRPGQEAVQAFGARAHYRTRPSNEVPPARFAGCISYQEPPPGTELDSDSEIWFAAYDQVPVPPVAGMRVNEARELLGYFCLELDLLDVCGGQIGHPTVPESDLLITTQCSPAFSYVAPGNHVGVVVSNVPPPDEDRASVIFFLMGAGAGLLIGLVFAIWFMVQNSSLRDELATFKQPRAPRNG